MINKTIRYLLIFLLLATLAFSAMPTANSITQADFGDALYSWENTGFLIGNKVIYLPNSEYLAENPQVVTINDTDEDLYLLFR